MRVEQNNLIGERFSNPFSRRSIVIGDVLITASMDRDSREQSDVIGGVLTPASMDLDSREQNETI